MNYGAPPEQKNGRRRRVAGRAEHPSPVLRSCSDEMTLPAHFGNKVVESRPPPRRSRVRHRHSIVCQIPLPFVETSFHVAPDSVSSSNVTFPISGVPEMKI